MTTACSVLIHIPTASYYTITCHDDDKTGRSPKETQKEDSQAEQSPPKVVKSSTKRVPPRHDDLSRAKIKDCKEIHYE